MKPLAFITSAIATGLLLGFVIVATAPYRTTDASARSLGKPLPDLAGQPLDDAELLLDRRGIVHTTTDEVGLVESLFISDRQVCETFPPGPAFVRPGESVELVVDSYC